MSIIVRKPESFLRFAFAVARMAVGALVCCLFAHGAAAEPDGVIKPPFPKGFVPPKAIGRVLPHIPSPPHYDITACLVLDIGVDGSTSNITVTRSTGVAFFDAAIVEMYFQEEIRPRNGQRRSHSDPVAIALHAPTHRVSRKSDTSGPHHNPLPGRALAPLRVGTS